MSYDPKTGKWTQIVESDSSTDNKNSVSSSTSPTASEKTPGTVQKNESQRDSEKEYITKELYTLVGSVDIIPNKKTVKMREATTINLEGFGNHLSGQYFVTEVARNIDTSSGYTQSVSVLKNGFGKSLKSPIKEPTNPDNQTPSPSPVSINQKVKITGEAVYGHAHDGVRVPNWVKENSLKGMYTVTRIDEAKKCALIQNINSWVYLQYLTTI